MHISTRGDAPTTPTKLFCHPVFACKVGDGNPLRRWRVSVEVLATPSEVLQRLLRERPLWQTELQQEKVLETLDKQTDVYQYSCRNMAPQPSCDYVVLRSGSVTLSLWV